LGEIGGDLLEEDFGITSEWRVSTSVIR